MAKYHYTRAPIEAHLSIVFTALAVAHAIQSRTDLSIAQVVEQLRPLNKRHHQHQRIAPNIPTSDSRGSTQTLDDLGSNPGY